MTRSSCDVLGLLPRTAYRMQVVAYGNDLSAESDTLAFTTGDLPADLPSYQAGGTDPSPGFVAFAANTYGIVIDNTGRVVWYRAASRRHDAQFPATTHRAHISPTR